MLTVNVQVSDLRAGWWGVFHGRPWWQNHRI